MEQIEKSLQKVETKPVEVKPQIEPAKNISKPVKPKQIEKPKITHHTKPVQPKPVETEKYEPKFVPIQPVVTNRLLKGKYGSMKISKVGSVMNYMRTSAKFWWRPGIICIIVNLFI